jgi:hypothetical protein
MIAKQIQKIDYAIWHKPTLLPTLVEDKSIKRGLLMSRLNRIIPHRVGIEFELIGDFMRNYSKVHKELKSNDQVKNHFNVLDFSEDWFNYTSRGQMNEVRVSINNSFQLKGLYKILQCLKEYCEIPIGGGIHIHIDISQYSNIENNNILANYIGNRLDDVQDIFPVYTGTYNKRIVGIHQKGTWVNISILNSIEFRIAPLTFEYNELLTWIVKCNKFVSKAIKDCHLKRSTQSKRETRYSLDYSVRDLYSSSVLNREGAYYTYNMNQNSTGSYLNFEDHLIYGIGTHPITNVSNRLVTSDYPEGMHSDIVI